MGSLPPPKKGKDSPSLEMSCLGDAGLTQSRAARLISWMEGLPCEEPRPGWLRKERLERRFTYLYREGLERDDPALHEVTSQPCKVHGQEKAGGD